jgi:hypothetical protein
MKKIKLDKEEAEPPAYDEHYRSMIRQHGKKYADTIYGNVDPDSEIAKEVWTKKRQDASKREVEKEDSNKQALAYNASVLRSEAKHIDKEENKRERALASDEAGEGPEAAMINYKRAVTRRGRAWADKIYKPSKEEGDRVLVDNRLNTDDED